MKRDSETLDKHLAYESEALRSDLFAAGRKICEFEKS